MTNLNRILVAALLTSVPLSTKTAHAQPSGIEPGTWEGGLYWGLFLPSEDHELFDADTASVSHQELESVSPELGLRLGWFPAQVLGLELEAGLLPSQVVTGGGANLYALRAHALLMAPTTSVVPFLLAGGGALGVSSENDVLGSDLDGSLHVGLGMMVFATPDLAVRLEARDNVTMGRGAEQLAQHWEALLGLSVVSGRPEPPPPPPPDGDGDGVLDGDDKCPTEAGPAPEGCPPPPDTDGDGILDSADKCPTVAGVASAEADKNGCPPPPPDRDGDGVPDADDKCPEVVGDGPDGCLQDSDADGIPNQDDKCANQPETKNGYEDQDGCPDELPQAVKEFTGAIEGIAFEANKATIRPSSFPKLDAAAKVLTEYSALRVEISGHTDTSGKPERNLELSGQRAEAVKTYLVSKGVATERVVTRGAGDKEPVADNASKEGRARNRRIEFKLLQ